ncbi:tetratricopeptide repeat-containing sensor histidine kinase [Hymenobacter lapidiphilus]|uniref:histidine kinase n=1 Tax=Hymenobacter lapidiphilus TaxID=2608003 RepID=A0A7Y7PLK1_9BACT|nr:tetratricopeptide repeat protein [Hymenobacter lapidiphilus]NVO30010.1 tetratricopeptide repeat protein [Hymenobacter lapidiphilus]
MAGVFLILRKAGLFRPLLLLSLTLLGLLLPLAPLRASIPNAPAAADTIRVQQLNQLAFELRSSNPRLSRTRFEEAAALATRLGYAPGQAQAWLGLGYYYRKRNEYAPALAFTQQAARVFRQQHDALNLIGVGYNLSYIYFGQGNYARALASAQQGLTQAEKLRDNKWLVLTNAQLGFISTQLGEYGQALAYLEQSRILARQTNDKGGVAQSLRGLGDLYQAQGQWTQARRYYTEGAALARSLGDNPGRIVLEVYIADMAERQGRSAEALRYARQARAELRRLDVVGYLPLVDLVLARAQLRLRRPDSAIYYGRPGLQASQERGVKEDIRDGSRVLAEASARLGRFADAYRYHRLFAAYDDSLSSRALIRRTAALQYGFELRQQQARIGELTRTTSMVRQQNQQQQWLLGVSGIGLVLVTGLSVVLGSNYRQKKRAYELLSRQQSELVATQRQLVAAEKWAFVGELSAGIAHELQNPLNFMNRLAVVSNELLEQETAGAVGAGGPTAAPDELGQEIMSGLRRNLHEISQHGQRASSIINSMLAHARTGAVALQPTSLNTLVARQLRLAYEGRPDTVLLLPAGVLHPMLGDDLPLVPVLVPEMERVLLNLFTNALYALADRAVLAGPGYVPELLVSTVLLAGQVQVRVRDNGTGMSPAVQERIFQPFFTTKPVGEGTGLGLSLAHDIITKGHGGTLRVVSEEGHFTEFTLTLPLKQG